MQVIEEDGGRLNAFAKEPRMVVMDEGEANGPNRPLLIGGVVLVGLLMAVAAGITAIR
ncbi:MAG: ssl1498 family light-harvesting-like protein [Cyanobium sp. ELA507]